MNIIATLIAALLLIPSVSSAAQTTAASSIQATGSRVYVVSGNVFAAKGKNPAHPVIGSEPIVSDTLISTGDKSSALLKFEDGQVVTMQANSVFHVRNYRYDAAKISNSSVVFSMLKGGMRFITGLIGQQRKQAFRLSTPNATIGIRGTEFMVTMANSKMYSQVLKGSVDMTNAGGTAVLATGQSAVAASSKALATLIPASAIPPGIFSELLSIPVQPSAIPASASAPVSAPAAAGSTASAAASAGAVTAGASLGVATAKASGTAAGAASVAGASIGLAGGALGALAGTDSKTKPAAAQPATPVADLQKPAEPAKVSDQTEPVASSRSGFGLTVKAGTLGYGGDINVGFSESLSTRFGINAYRNSYTGNASAMDFKFKTNLQTASALADWYPFAGSFRTSGGVYYNNNKFSLTAIPTGGNFIINGVTYTSAQVASLAGTVLFNKVAPYFGIGWGNPVANDKGWGLVSDFGILFQGKPKLDLVVTCAATCPGTLQANAAAENAKLQSDLDHFQFWPVASIGISYQW